MSANIAMLVVGVVLFYTGQGFFSKLYSLSRSCNASDAAPGFNLLYGLIVAFGTLVFSGFLVRPDTLTLLLGCVNGITLFLYNFSAIHTAQSGPYTLQGLMSSFGNILIPMLFAITLWGDTLKGVQTVGIILLLIAFLLYNARRIRGIRMRPKDFVWFLMVFITNGIYSPLNDTQQRMESGSHRQDMIIVTFFTAALFSMIFLLLPRNTGARRALHMPARALIHALLSGVSAAAAINTLMTALHYVPSSLLYPISAGSLLITNTLLSRFVLRETLTGMQYLGIAFAVAGVVLTNI